MPFEWDQVEASIIQAPISIILTALSLTMIKKIRSKVIDIYNKLYK